MTTRIWCRGARHLALGFLAGALLLSGCGAGEEAAERVAEEALEEAASGEAEVDVEDGSIKVETDEGTFSYGENMPEDFPLDEVPLLEGEVVSGSSMAGEGWQVSMVVDGEEAEVFEQGRQQLADAGYTQDATTQEAGETRSYTGSGGTFTVNLLVLPSDQGSTVNYTVTPLS